jgi:hypothetical protein
VSGTCFTQTTMFMPAANLLPQLPQTRTGLWLARLGPVGGGAS